MLKKIYQKILIVSILIFFSFSLSSQCLVVPVNLETRVQQSAAIVEGRILSKTSYWNSSGTMIYTAYEAEVYKIFKGSPFLTRVEIITEGGEVGFQRISMNPNLELIPGDVGIFMLEQTVYPKKPGSPVAAEATFRIYALNQGFVKYNEQDQSATDVFNSYTNIPVEVYSRIESITGIKHREQEWYSITAISNRTLSPPFITGVSPTNVSAGTGSTISISGIDFGASMGSSTVRFKDANDGGATYFNAPASEIVSWSNTLIVVKVPADAGTGPIQIDVPAEGTGTFGGNLQISFSNINLTSSGAERVTRLVNDNGSGGYTFQYFTGFNSNAPAVAAFERAFFNWRCATLVNWQLGATTTADSVGSDGINVVRFDIGSELPMGVLGQAASFYSSCNGINWHLAEVDIRYDDGTSWYYGTGTPGGSEYDFESVSLHELGHGHQLGHVIDGGAVMHFALANGATSRVLSSNDIAGGNVIMNRSTSGSLCSQPVMTAIAAASCSSTAVGDYRSKQNGDWNTPGSWERYDGSSWVTAVARPDSTSGKITIRNGHTITIGIDHENGDQILIEAGGTLDLSSLGVDLTLGNGPGTDMTINGTFIHQNGQLMGLYSNVIVGSGGVVNYNGLFGRLVQPQFTNNGTINWNSGELIRYNTLINNSTLNIAGNDNLNNATLTQAIINNGTINKSSSGISQFSNFEWTNNGTLNLNNGTFLAAINTNNAGIINIASGAVFNNSSFIYCNPGTSIIGNGTFLNNSIFHLSTNVVLPSSLTFNSPSGSNVSGTGDLTINRDFTFLHINTANGILTVNGNIDFQEGALNQKLTIAFGRILNFNTANAKSFTGDSLVNNGTINWNDGSLNPGGSFVFRNNNQFNITGDNGINQFGTNSFQNFGTVTKSSTGLTVSSVSWINHPAGIIKGVGTLNLPFFTQNGTIEPGLSPGILNLDGSPILSSTSKLSLEIAGGGGAGNPTGHDQLQHTNTLTLDGNLTVVETGSVPFGDYTVLDLHTNGGVLVGTFSSTTLPAGYVVLYFTDSVVVRKVCIPSVSISASPGNTICAGTNVTFTATPTNGGTPTYQWKRNGTNVGTNSSTYSSTGLVNGDVITCVMTSSLSCTNGSPNATSNAITMTVNPIVVPSVSIASSPGSTICAGTNVTFTATPTNGGTTPAYQWKLNGVNVGSNSATYMNSTLNHNDVVTCVLTSNALCATPVTATSNMITMTVNPLLAPSVSIAASPGNTICAGTSVTFTATPTNGGATPSYQWKLNGSNVGTNSNTYTNSTLVNGDVVSCVMTSSYVCPSPATATSNNVTMTVNPVVVPSVSIAASPGNTICAGTNVIFTATPANGGTTPAYQWKLNGSNVGTNSATYSNSSLVNGDVLSCVLTSNALCASPATANSNNITMTVNPIVTPSVSISASPGTTICSGTNVTFTATPTNGGTTPSYQWKLNGGNVGSNSSSYSNASLANNDQVSVVMTSNAGCLSTPAATSNTITMSVTGLVVPSVSISANPGSTICTGTNVVFTAVPTNGGLSPGYQWKLNGSNVGTNSDSYSNASLVSGDMVSCVMTSSFSCASPATATSNTITMTVNAVLTPSVSISASPGNVICAGTSVTFTATPTNGGSTPSYQWKLNGGNVGTNSAAYSNASLANGDVVTCVMTPSISCPSPATATSNAITMTVTAVLTPSVSISASPGNTICAGTSVTFTATPTNGGSTPSYQWKLNGANVGTNSPTYTNTSLANGNSIECVMTSSYACPSPATATSNTIIMTVNAVLTPSVSIAANPGNSICAGTSVTYTATPTNGGSTPSYQWKLNGANVGTNSPTYTNTSLTNGNTIECVMTSSYVCPSPATATSNTITMTVNAVLTPSVSISASPGSTICTGTSVTFTATPVNGGSTPSYQWKLNSVNVGTNSVTYTNSTLTNGDVVECVMTTSYVCPTSPTATSNTITMSVTGTVVPSVSISASPGSTICAGTNVTFTATPTNGGSSPSYQWKLNGANVGTNSPTYSNASLANGNTIECVMTSSFPCAVPASATSNTITMSVMVNVTPSVSISASPGNTICAGTSVTFTAMAANGGTPAYQWKLNGSNVGTNSATYTNASLAAADVITCVMTTSVTCVTSPTATSNAITMTVNPILTPSVSISVSPGSTICAGTNVTFAATPVNGGSTPSYQWKLNGGNVGSNSATYSSVSLANGDMVSVVMTTSYSCPSVPTATSNTITMTVNPLLTPSVSIAANPGNVICPGTSVTFTATPANGGSTPSYQWKLNGGNVGTNSATYTNSALVNGDVVSCVLTSNANCASPVSATSNAVTMTVNTVPQISVHPQSQTVFVGNNVTFSVTASGTGLMYQWRKNGTNISGANSSSYTITGVVTGDAGNYDVIVSGTCTPSVTSNTAVLTVNTVTITTQPSNQAGCVGTGVTFNVVAAGPNLTYQWQLSVSNGPFNNITGATNSSLIINPLSIGMNGNRYRCVVSGLLNSNAALLTVYPLPVVSFILPVDTIYKHTPILILSGGLPAGGTFTGNGISAGRFLPANNPLGNYTVTYTYTDANGCTNAATDVFTLVPAADFVNLYPNPAENGRVTIVVVPALIGSKVTAYNNLGQKVEDWVLPGRMSSYDLKWAAGHYTLVFSASFITETKQLIIRR